MLIITFFNSFFKLYYCRNFISTTSLKIDNIIYRKDKLSEECEGFLGFFDWLRLTDSEIVGIRICYFEDLLYNQVLKQFSYSIPVFENKCFEILFNGNKYNAEISGDQDFTNNFVYKSGNTDYLFTFGLDHLTKIELESLMKHCKIMNEESFIQ